MSVAPPTESPAGPAPEADRGPGRRRLLLLAGLALVVVAALVLGVALASQDDGRATTGTPSSPSAAAAAEGTASGAPTSAPSPGAAPEADAAATPESTPASVPAPTADPNEAPPSLPPVDLDRAVPVLGVVASVSDIEAFTGQAVGPGNVNGPALRVTIRLENGTDADLSLDGVAVAVAYGADRTPASPLDDPSQSPFAGTLPAGEAAEAVYVFSVPADAGDQLTVSVGHQPGAPIAVFAGTAG
jgi:hypothetical protein